MQVDVPPVPVFELQSAPAGERSESVRMRVENARKLQAARFAENGQDGVFLNAHASGEALEQIAALDAEAQGLLQKSMENTKLSARGYYRLLKVARTIADIAGQPGDIGKAHLAEALSYRRSVYT